MKLYASDNTVLMEIEKIEREGNCLMIEGIIMDSMPICTILKPTDLRKVFKLMSIKNLLFAASMFFRTSK